MQILITRHFKKHLSVVKEAFSKKEFHSSQDINLHLNQMEANILQCLKSATESVDQKLSQSKNQLKKRNKAFNQLKSINDKKEFQWVKQRDILRRQVQKNRKKVQDLLKFTKNQAISESVSSLPKNQDKGSQCSIIDSQQQILIERIKKQNISLNLKSVQLQQIIREKDQDIYAANALIKQLIKQLDTNISDRETGYGNSSETQSEEIQTSEQDFQNSSDNQLQFSNHFSTNSQDSADCGRIAETQGQQCSTIDGSNATNRDFALPQWLQFEQTATPQHDEQRQFDKQDQKMWPQLILNRIRQLIGLSYQI